MPECCACGLKGFEQYHVILVTINLPLFGHGRARFAQDVTARDMPLNGAHLKLAGSGSCIAPAFQIPEPAMEQSSEPAERFVRPLRRGVEW